MPPRRPARKNNRRRNFRRKRLGKPPIRSLAAPNTYRFKRTIAETLILNQSEPPDGWSVQVNNLGKAFGWTLSAVNDYTDFTNLFKYYRLKGARVRMYFSNTTSVVSDGTNEPNNGQILMSIDRNMDGDATNVATESHYLDSQTTRRKLCLRNDGKPIDIYMPLRQLTEIVNVAGTSTSAMVSPKWVGTEEYAVPHYGYNIMLQRVDGQGFSQGINAYQRVKMLTTLYFECKKVE